MLIDFNFSIFDFGVDELYTLRIGMNNVLDSKYEVPPFDRVDDDIYMPNFQPGRSWYTQLELKL